MPTAGRDIIVIGASTGGVEALCRLVSQLPADLPAAVFVVLHISPNAPSLLGKILDRAGPLHAAAAQEGEPIRHSRIYVAPPDYHLMVANGHVQLARGPKENRSRPAVDPLFRSAAEAYGARVVGVILTGFLDDGTAGLMAIKRSGGTAVVQDPDDAMYPQMPRSAIQNVEVDHVVGLEDMGELLERLTRQPPPEGRGAPPDVGIEAHLAENLMSNPAINDALGEPSAFACPECGGTLWELHSDKLRRYRCHLGHAYSVQALLADQNETTERTIWAALRLMEERANILATLANDERATGRHYNADRYQERANEWREHGQRLRVLLQRGQKDVPEAAEAAE